MSTAVTNQAQIAEITRVVAENRIPPGEFRLILKIATLVAAGGLLAEHIRESHSNADSKIPPGLAAAMKVFDL